MNLTSASEYCEESNESKELHGVSFDRERKEQNQRREKALPVARRNVENEDEGKEVRDDWSSRPLLK